MHYLLNRYEEEIGRLKAALELASNAQNAASDGSSALSMIKFPTVPNLEGEHISTGMAPFAFNMAAEAGLPPSKRVAGGLLPAHHQSFVPKGHTQMIYDHHHQNEQIRRTSVGGGGNSLRPPFSSIMTQYQFHPSTQQVYANTQHVIATQPSSVQSGQQPQQQSQHPQQQHQQQHASSVQPNALAMPPTGYDWLVVYNPKVQRSVTIDLQHNLPHESVVCCVRFSPDGRILATGGNRLINLWSVASGEKLACLQDEQQQQQQSNQPDQYVRSLAFTPDSRYLISGSEDRLVRIWNLGETRRLVGRLEGHDLDIYSIDVSPDGSRIVSGSGDRTVRVWELRTDEGGNLVAANGQESQILPMEDEQHPPQSAAGVEAGVTSVSISPDGKYVAAGSLDRLVRVWRLEATAEKNHRLVGRLEGHKDSIYSVAFSPDGRHLISGSLDRSLKVWELEEDADELKTTTIRITCKHTILGHKDYVLSVAATPPDGRWIVSGSKDRTVQVWDARTGTTQLMLQGHKNSVICVAVSPCGRVFATASGDLRARLWSFNINAEEKSNASSIIKTPSTPQQEPQKDNKEDEEELQDEDSGDDLVMEEGDE